MGDIVELKIESPAHGGECIGRLDGKVILVSCAIPGERVRARILKSKKNLAWAKTVEVLSASPERISHIWPLAEKEGIGGVELGHVSLEGGMAWKKAVIADQTRRIGGSDAAAALKQLDMQIEPGASKGLHQRIRVEFEVNEQGQASMYRAGSHELVPIDSMPLANEQINALGLFGTDQWEFVPGDRIRVVASSADAPKIVANKNVWGPDGEPATPVVKYPLSGPVHPGGEDEVILRAMATDFWQAHVNAPHLLFSEVMEAVGEDPGRVIELFSGSGLFTVGLANRAQSLQTFEGGRSAVTSAQKNLRALGLQAQVVQARINAKTLANSQADTFVLDPPRAGAGRELIHAMATAGAKKIVHVACDVAAMARDASYYLAEGYSWTRAQAFDLFPYTHHVEQVSVFEK